MKFIIIPILILLLLFSACLYNIHVTNIYARDISELIYEAGNMVDHGNWEEAESLVIEAQEKHLLKRNYLFSVSHHAPINDLDTSFRLILADIKHQDDIELAENIEIALSALDIFCENQKLTLGNLI